MTAELTHRGGLAVLLVVALTLAGCGGDDRASGPSCQRADVDFAEPTTRLTFRVTGANPAHVEQARRILCVRRQLSRWRTETVQSRSYAVRDAVE